MASDAKIAAKIKALRNLAEHPGTPEAERLAASEKLAELLEKYAIDELLLREDHGASEKIVKREYLRTGIYWQAEKSNVYTLARALGMQSYYWQPSGHGKQQVLTFVVGFESDFAKFETLLTSMTIQLDKAWKMYRKGFDESQLYFWRTGTDMYRFKTRRSFMVGYGSGFTSRVKTGRQHAAEKSGSTGAELVLVDRTARVKDHFRETEKDLKAARGMALNSAYYAGQEAGSRAQTGEDALPGKGELD